eukprot:TRINITY_DN1427_c2_g2_i1.p1 TRINITY_DN1427_c2_g2~~TRINITY_DN1427_c2_g2_i1.p1  ORF type:complete len:899 (+),score=158.79 TRINITY_DN1427_c2_g2_i1:377-2698(+)
MGPQIASNQNIFQITSSGPFDSFSTWSLDDTTCTMRKTDYDFNGQLVLEKSFNVPGDCNDPGLAPGGVVGIGRNKYLVWLWNYNGAAYRSFVATCSNKRCFVDRNDPGFSYAMNQVQPFPRVYVQPASGLYRLFVNTANSTSVVDSLSAAVLAETTEQLTFAFLLTDGRSVFYNSATNFVDLYIEDGSSISKWVSLPHTFINRYNVSMVITDVGSGGVVWSGPCRGTYFVTKDKSEPVDITKMMETVDVQVCSRGVSYRQQTIDNLVLMRTLLVDGKGLIVTWNMTNTPDTTVDPETAHPVTVAPSGTPTTDDRFIISCLGSVDIPSVSSAAVLGTGFIVVWGDGTHIAKATTVIGNTQRPFKIGSSSTNGPLVVSVGTHAVAYSDVRSLHIFFPNGEMGPQVTADGDVFQITSSDSNSFSTWHLEPANCSMTKTDYNLNGLVTQISSFILPGEVSCEGQSSLMSKRSGVTSLEDGRYFIFLQQLENLAFMSFAVTCSTSVCEVDNSTAVLSFTKNEIHIDPWVYHIPGSRNAPTVALFRRSPTLTTLIDPLNNKTITDTDHYLQSAFMLKDGKGVFTPRDSGVVSLYVEEGSSIVKKQSFDKGTVVSNFGVGGVLWTSPCIGTYFVSDTDYGVVNIENIMAGIGRQSVCSEDAFWEQPITSNGNTIIRFTNTRQQGVAVVWKLNQRLPLTSEPSSVPTTGSPQPPSPSPGHDDRQNHSSSSHVVIYIIIIASLGVVLVIATIVAVLQYRRPLVHNPEPLLEEGMEEVIELAE